MALMTNDELKGIVFKAVPRLKPKSEPDKDERMKETKFTLRQLARQHMDRLGR